LSPRHGASSRADLQIWRLAANISNNQQRITDNGLELEGWAWGLQLLTVMKYACYERLQDASDNKVTGGWRKLHNEELHNLYSSPSIIRMIISRRMRLVGHIARKGIIGMDIRYW
jgi:hypothetical protein